MQPTFVEFDRRTRRLRKKHFKLAKGYTTKMNGNMIVEHRPRNKAASSIPFKGLLMMVAGLAFFKAVIIAHLGTTVYGERIAKLADGTWIEQGGAFVMQIEPVSMFVARFVAPFIG